MVFTANTNLPHIPGYSVIEQLYTGSKTSVYRAQPDNSHHWVVIKVLQREYPSFSELVQFRNQYTIAKNLDIPGIVRPLSLEPWHNSFALVMEDYDGISLKQYAQDQDLDWLEVLVISLQLTEILHHLIQHRVVHKDIKPANILIHPSTGIVKIIDFSISSLLPKEIQELKNPNVLEGTLAYLAPEQTGRMNRGIDYRTDFYSLGVTLYELLTGQLPFICDDPLELVHCHIAKQPIPPHEINQNIPMVVSQIVLKLMAKNAEDRYQSALGIKYDLEKCVSQGKETGTVTEFELAKRDVSDRFLIPEKLYGREAEVEQLLGAFERISQSSVVSEKSQSELILVAGLSGIGKTAVVNEVHKPIVRQKGYFIKGKFDQFNRNIPFSALVQALRDLMGQLLSESDSQLQQWQDKIIDAVVENGQVIIEVIPELEIIIGKQPAVTELSGSAAQNRFNLLFSKFIQVFTTKDHPLVLFLDDLQWADSASLNLLKLLMSEGERGYLLIIGAYRDNEVFPAHPLMLTLDEIAKESGIISTITLSPLSEKNINNLVADTLSCISEIAKALTNLVYQKTKGNPFFTTQFLLGLYEKELINFNREVGHWECDISEVRQQSLTDDVVEFMAQRLQNLPAETQNVLKLAACIGNQFDLHTLAIVCEKSKEDTAESLWRALHSGLILPKSEVYKFYLSHDQVSDNNAVDQNAQYRFLHDRVQQASYSLIPENQKQLTHLKIGQFLLQKLSPHEQSEQLFSLVNQFNLGKAAISNPEEKRQLASLNLQAGKKAKLSAAYQVAQNYCTIGIDLLPTSAWHSCYQLIYNLHRYGSEAAYLCGNFAEAEALYTEALNHAQTALDQGVIYRVQMTQYQLQGRNAEAITIQRQSLLLLGWEVPIEQEVIKVSLDEEIAKVSQFLEKSTIQSILNLPKMEGENIAEMLRILQILFYAAWLDGQITLSLLAVAKMTTLSLQHGNSDMSPFGYVGYGLIANVMLKDATTAYQFGDMAVQLCEQFDNADVRGMTNFLFAADVHSWSRPIREADIYYENAYKYGMEAGNWLTVGFMMMQSGSDRLTYGKNLRELYTIAEAHADFLSHIKSLENLDALLVGVVQPIRNLLGLTKTIFTFDDDDFNESEYLQKYSNTPYHLAWFYSVKIRHAYLFNHQAAYPDLITKLYIIENATSSHTKLPSSVFYVALMHLDLAETLEEEKERKIHLEKLIYLEEKLNTWQNYCPENILHKCLIIQAEKARLNGQKTKAIDLYEQAITTAHTNQYDYEEALANELAAKFYLEWGKETIAAVYMQQAYYCYARWGAKAKTDDLENRYPKLLQPILQQPSQSFNPFDTLTTITQSNFSIHSSQTATQSSKTSINSALDFAAVLKASQALSGVIELDELLRQLTQIILQNSGGDRCALILPDSNGKWHVRAISQPEETELCSQPLENNSHLPTKLIQYVKNTQEVVAIDNLNTDLPVIDEYLQLRQPKSLLCLPILNQGHLIGILYLKNCSTSGAFTPERIIILNFLCTQAAISLENAHLYEQLKLSENRLKTIFEKASDAILLLSDQGFIDCNQSCVDLFGIPGREAIYSLHPAQMSPKFQPDGQLSLEKAKVMMQTAYQKGNHKFEWIHKRSNGEEFWAEVTLTPILYKEISGEIINCLHAIVRDISDRKHAQSIVIKKSQELETALGKLQNTQLQMVQHEKMASLGNLVAGVAHEINNPLGFLNGSINNAKDYLQDIIAHLELYQEYHHDAAKPIQANAEKIDLKFLCEDFPRMLDSMEVATKRIKNISTSLRTFSRADIENKVSADLHEGLDSTLLILKYRLKANDVRPAIQVIKDYGALSTIECFPGQLNQVFMNIIANAIDVFDEAAQSLSYAELEAKPQIIKIKTALITEKNAVKIMIEDNGKGMKKEVMKRIFDHLFTTKGVGKGTGLGLAIAQQIIVDKHGGELGCRV